MRRLALTLAVVMLMVLIYGLIGLDPVVSAGEKRTLVISTWGYNEDLLWKNIYQPFEKKYDVKIVLEHGNNADRLNKIRLRQNGGVDLIYLAESFTAEAIKEGLFQEINRDNIPNLTNIYQIARAPFGEKYGPAYTIGRYGIIYDADATEQPVTSWFDLWREEFERAASIPDINTTSGPNILLMAAEKAGVSIKDDQDRAFAELKKMEPNLVKMYSRSSDLANMFAQGEVVIAAAQDFAYSRIKKAVLGAKWVDPVEGAFANLNSINIVKGSRNKDLAEKFINFVLSEEVQKALALDKVDSPVNINVVLSEEEAAGLTYGQKLIKNLIKVDWQYINSVKKNWINRWNREIAY